jgi:hypothetical protein
VGCCLCSIFKIPMKAEVRYCRYWWLKRPPVLRNNAITTEFMPLLCCWMWSEWHGPILWKPTVLFIAFQQKYKVPNCFVMMLFRPVYTYRAVPLPCCAVAVLNCDFPIWFTQCDCVWFTHAEPWPCQSESNFSRPRCNAAWAWAWTWHVLTFWLRDTSTCLTFNSCTFCPHCIDVLCKQRLVPLTA